MLLAERFGKFPEECEDRDADRALFYNAILGIEGKANRLIKDLRPGDELVLADDEDP